MDATLDWVRIASDSWAALPADDLLVPDPLVAACLGVPPFTPAERLALGMLARVIGYRHSLSLVVPGADGDTFRKALILLHRMRYDARWGWVRTPWLNAGTLADRPHAILWTKARRRFTEWIGTPGLQCFLDPAMVPRANRDSHEAHTLLLDPTGDVYGLLESIDAARISPFVILVDAELFGPTLPLDTFCLALRETFLGVPIVVIGGPGDISRLDVLRQLDGHTVVLRTGDVQRWTIQEGGQPVDPAWRLLVVPDGWIDPRLKVAHQQYRALQDRVKRDPDAHCGDWVRPLGKVLQSVRALACGLPSLERELERRARGGPFPVAPLGRWLERAAEGAGRYADTHAAVAALKTTLTDLHAGLVAGVPGKAQALVEDIRQAVARNKTLRVLVGSEAEGMALDHWLSDEGLGNAVSEGVDIVAMDSSRGWRQARFPVDHLWIAGTLWPNRHRWLTVPAGRMTIPCYPFEKLFIARLLGAWWDQFGRESHPAGDKLRLWRLDLWGGFLRDLETAGPVFPLQENLSSCRGDYPRSPVSFHLPFTDRHDDWMERLLASHDPIQDNEYEPGQDMEEGAHVLIHLEERARPLAWPRSTPIQVLGWDGDTEPLKDILPDDLKAGQQIILTEAGSRRSILEVLFRAFAEDSVGLEQHLAFAHRWQDLVQETLQKLRTPAAMRKQLADAGIKVVEATVRTWVKGRVIGPENPVVIAVFAAACGWSQAAVRAGRISNAIKAVRSERRRLGHDLRDAFRARAAGAEKLRIGRAELDPAVLDDLLSLETVVRVEVPVRTEKHYPKSAIPPPLIDIPRWIEERHPGRLIFTSAALRSLKDCHFRDVELARQALELMATWLFETYRDGGRIQETIMAFKAIGIDFAGATANSTQGRSHRYDRRYKGRRVDIGAHLKLGIARDPTLTMRIHFHWDDDDRQLVIHHAGEHLPVLSS